MREIKFRAWDAALKKMWYQVERYNGHGETAISFYDVISSTRFIPMQFTGLLDKDEKPIYEGDILEVSNMEFSHFEDSGVPDSPNEIFENIRGTVSFDKGQFEVDGHSLGEIPLSAIKQIDITVIGNVYENHALTRK
jgi:uncharacterized phage protein (TIGR01671 family)